jgi:hypothetical protein
MAGRRSKRATRRQTSQYSAQARGVHGIRRVIDPASLRVFESINDRLESEIRGLDRLIHPSTLTVTIIGFSRFNKRLKDRGPSTREIIESVPSFSGPIPAELGKLGIFGSGNAHKLAFELISPEIEEEIDRCEEEYRSRGFPLLEDYNTENRRFMPHCSIAFLHKDNIGHHRERRNLARYTAITKELGSAVMLAPPISRD